MDPTVKSLLEYEPVAKLTRDCINQLESDLDLLHRDVEIFYSIDFSEIYDFIHPFTYEPDYEIILKMPGESLIDTLTREHIALNFIFNYQKPILLPNYSVELKNHFEILRLNSDYATAVYKSKQTNEMIFNILADKHIHNILKKYSSKDGSRPISDKTVLNFASYIKSNFKELYYIMSYPPDEILDTIKRYKELEDNNLVNLFDDWKRRPVLELNQVLEKGKDYYQKLKHFGDQGENARYIDGIGISFLQKINKVLNQENCVLFFITRSKIIARCIKKEDIINIDNIKYNSPIRTIEYFLTDILHKRKDIYQTRNAIFETKKRLDLFEELFNSIKEIRNDFWNHDLSKEDQKYAQKILNDLKEVVVSRENIEYALSQKHIEFGLTKYDWPKNKFISKQQKIARRIFSLLSSQEPVRQYLKTIREEINEEINSKVSSISMFLMVDKEKLDKISNFIESNTISERELSLQSLGAEMPTIVRFSNAEVIRLAKGLTHKKEGTNRNKMIANIILNIAKKTDFDCEIHLLRAYIFALLNSANLAQLEISQGLSRLSKESTSGNNTALILELLLIKIVIHRRSKEILEGIQTCDICLKYNKDDPRLLRELAVLVWQAISMKGKSSKIIIETILNKLNNYDISIETSISLAEIAANCAIKHGIIEAQIFNSLAYFYLEKSKLKRKKHNLSRAKEYLDKLETEYSTGIWISRFRDTRGYYHLLNYKYSNDQIHSLRLAIKEFNSALSDKYLPEYERKIINRHLFKAENTLKDLI